MNAYSIIFLACETQQCASGSVVEHLLAKEGVAGSIPVSRFFFTIKWVPLVGTHFIVKTSPRGSNRFDFSPAGSVGASPLRGESSTGRPHPVSRFFNAKKTPIIGCLFALMSLVPDSKVRFLACRLGRCFSTLWRVVHWTTVPRFIFLICYINFIIKKCWSTKISHLH